MFGLFRIATTLTTWWWLLLSLMFLLYIALDGADLGAGVFALFFSRGAGAGRYYGFHSRHVGW